jgi:uncharacterized protein YndB with AHSA1/START domain
MRFRCRTEDLGFLDRARWKWCFERELAAPASRLWALLADAPGWAQWFESMKSVEWTSEAPHGVGSTRTVHFSAVTLEERFIRWDEGKALAFHGEASSWPMFTALVEEYVVEELEGDRCRFIWRVGMDPSWIARIFGGAVRGGFDTMFEGAVDGLERALR